MLVSLQKTSLIDYPDRLAAVIFFPGCNLRCPWCHNSQLALNRGFAPGELIALEEVYALLKKRKNVLSGVVLSGGEALMRPEIPKIVQTLHKLGYLIKIDTNGMCPDALEVLLKEEPPDYIAFDLKIAPERYSELGLSGDLLKRSAEILAASNVAREYRSLILPPDFFTKSDIDALFPLTDKKSPWYFSPFRPGNCLDPKWDNASPPSPESSKILIDHARTLHSNIRSRGI